MGNEAGGLSGRVLEKWELANFFTSRHVFVRVCHAQHLMLFIHGARCIHVKMKTIDSCEYNKSIQSSCFNKQKMQ